MPAPRILGSSDARTETGALPGLWFAGALASVLILVTAAAAYLPAALMLPAVSMAMLTAGFTLAAVLALSARTGRSKAWDVAGALVFLAFGAAILSDSQDVLAVLDQWEARASAGLAK